MPDGPHPSRRGAAETTEAQIARAAVHLFAVRGFHATGIRHLAEEVGITTSTLYHYMGNKEDLLFRIVQDSSRRLIDAAGRIPTGIADEATIAGLVHIHVWSHASYPEETAVVDNELRALDDVRRAAAVALRDRYEQFWKKAIAAGARSGAFTVEDAGMARLALLQMCSGVAEWYSSRGKATLRHLTTTHAHMALGLLGGPQPFDAIPDLIAASGAEQIVTDLWPRPFPAPPSRITRRNDGT